MVFGFGGFVLDEERRELRLEGREIVLQPRVFDLLAFLVRHRDRTVGKDEILDSVWPDVVVTEGSLQRATSLARSALREGGLHDAIRTLPRKGYRFRAEVREVAAPSDACLAPAAVVRARHAFDACDWDEAVAAFASADEEVALPASDLERWAEALQWTGDEMQRDVLRRAVAAHAAAGDRRGAARAAVALGHFELERRELAVARGWNRHAARLLEGDPPSRELGLQLWLASRIAAFEKREDRGLALAERVHEIGRDLGDADLEVLGLLYRGLLLLARGEFERSVELQDEAAATALAGTVSPWVGGQVYCGVVWNCRNSADWERAAQWTDQFTSWCRQHGLASVPGTCKLHRAEVLSVRGDLSEAEREIAAACEALGAVDHWAEGDAYRVLGDLLRTRGDLVAAGEAYRRAHGLGWDPQPGLALLHLAEGRADEAVRGLQASLDDPGWPNRQRRVTLLAHLVVVGLAAGRGQAADAAMTELERHPESWGTAPALRALVEHARAEQARASGDVAGAVRGFRSALRGWRKVGAPVSMAEVRVRLADTLVALGDVGNAMLELDAAESTARERGLTFVARECARIRASLDAA